MPVHAESPGQSTGTDASPAGSPDASAEDAEERWHVEELLDWREDGGIPHYLFKWEGTFAEEATWEDETGIRY
jgi:hypothetical protein